MSATPFEMRIASLEGSYQQVSDRLNAIERHLGEIETTNATEFRTLRSEISSQFRRTAATISGSWITLLAAILFHH